MAKEIERKFLVSGDAWRGQGTGVRYRQGYLSTDPERTVRVRLEGSRARLTIKGISRGASRDEFEYDVPIADAEQMLTDLCVKPLIEKTRYKIPFGGRTWEVDVFEGDNHGLIVAEVELQSESDAVQLPPWVSLEVTDDPRYYNSSLARKPFKSW